MRQTVTQLREAAACGSIRKVATVGGMRTMVDLPPCAVPLRTQSSLGASNGFERGTGETDEPAFANLWEKDIEETQGHALNFPMLSDTDKRVANLYGMIHAE